MSTRTHFYTMLMLLLTCLGTTLQAQVVINEVQFNGSDRIELLNTGGAESNVSGWWLCSRFDYIQLNDAGLTLSGSLTIEPGGILVIEGFAMDDQSADLGLYSTPSFGSSSAIVDFVQWGGAGIGREGVAATAGIWTAGEFVPAVGAGSSIEYDGDGETAADWVEQTTPTFGAVNDAASSSEPLTYKARLTGYQEVLPVTTYAYGQVTAVLDGSSLTVTGSFEGLAGKINFDLAGGAHIHSGLAGQNGGIAFLLNITANEDSTGGTFAAENNTFTLTEEEITTLKARGFYVNIHSLAFPPGELRGQILPEYESVYISTLAGSNEVPAIVSYASGTLIFELNGDQLTVSGSFDNLSDVVSVDLAGGAHVHDAIAGRNGGVVFPLNLTLDDDQKGASVAAAENTFTLTEDQLAYLQRQRYYINVHSEAYRSGELRGQILPLTRASFRANLAGSQEVMPVNSAADGRVLVNYIGNGMITVSGSFNNLSSALNTDLAGGAHIHLGLPGTNGGIVVPLVPMADSAMTSGVFYPAQNTFQLEEESVADLFGRKLYVNVHSLNYVPGELRGQILHRAQAYFGTTLSGWNELEPVVTPAYGNMLMEYSAGTIKVSGSFAGLQGDYDVEIAGGSHLHLGNAAQNGGVSIILNQMLDDDLRGGDYYASNNTFELDSAQSYALKNGELYVNIHTKFSPSGELRGQVLREDNRFPSAAALMSPANEADVTIDAFNNDPFEVTWDIAEDPDGDLVVYAWQLSATGTFDSLLFQQKVGVEPSFTASQETISQLLESAGVANGDSIRLYHRVLSSDASVSTPGMGWVVNITRNDVVTEANVRLLKVDPETDKIYLKNFGGTAIDISAWRLCSEFSYTSDLANSVNLLSGSFTLEAGDTVAFDGWPLTDASADLGIYRATGGFGSAEAMIDFVQWGSAGNGRESVAVEKGIWGAGDFLDGAGPYTYQGNGDENGITAWSLSTSIFEDLTSTNSFRIYPNPAVQSATIEITSQDVLRNLSMEVLTTTGQVIRQENINNRLLNFERGSLTPGIYLIRLKEQDRVIGLKKLVILK
ncbi:MAG: CHRD domain-containing protein [Bacteroidota bacterium]